MIPAKLIAQSLLKLPAMSTVKLPVQLPLPQGAVMRGTLTEQKPQGEEKQQASQQGSLQLGSLKIPVDIPKGAQTGKVWVQLVKVSMPYQMKLLTPEQVEQHIARKLLEMARNVAQEQPGSQARQQVQQVQQHLPQSHSLPPALDQPEQPFRLVSTPDGGWQLWSKGDDEHLNGMLQAEQNGDAYQIQGRLDLEHAGQVRFTLQGATGEQPAVHLQVQADLQQFLQADFQQWLDVHDVTGQLSIERAAHSAYQTRKT